MQDRKGTRELVLGTRTVPEERLRVETVTSDEEVVDPSPRRAYRRRRAVATPATTAGALALLIAVVAAVIPRGRAGRWRPGRAGGI